MNCNNLIIEFIPKSDTQVTHLLKTREDIYLEYSEYIFENIFSTKFSIKKKSNIEGSDRLIYWMINNTPLKITKP